jgi:hypothetical protein
VGETTHGVDSLLSKIGIGGGVVVDLAVGAFPGFSDFVDLLVHLGTVVITVLTGASDLELDAGRVPSTDATNLAETSVGLTGKASDTPTSGDTLKTFTLGHTNDIDHLVLGEDGVDGDGLFEETVTPVNFGASITTVDLNFQHMGLLLAETDFLDVGVAQKADDGAEFLHAVEFVLDVLVAISRDTFVVSGEGLLLGVVPVFVEGALDGLLHVLGPHCSQGAETTGGFDVTDQTDSEHGGSFDDGDGFNNFLFVDFGAGLVGLTHDVGHTGFVTHEGGQVASSRLVILGEGLDAALDVGAALTREKSQGTITGSFKLTVRHNWQ